MLVYEGKANDLYRERSRIEKSRHFVYVHAPNTHCAHGSRVKFCAVMMRKAKGKVLSELCTRPTFDRCACARASF